MSERLPKPPWWLGLMLGLLCIYLLVEFIFNAVLVNTAGGKGIVDEQLHAVELFGRAISGVGASLLLADGLLRGRWLLRPSRALGVFAVILSLAWPTVFFGQKMLLEAMLIKPSTAEQRQRAVFSQTLKRALAENTIEIANLPYNSNAEHGPGEKTFLALFGALVYGDGTLIAEIESHKIDIATHFARTQAMADFDEHYGKYQRLRTDVRSRYDDYLGYSKQYNAELAKVSDYVDEKWREVEQQIKDGYRLYQQKQSSFDARMEARAQKLAPFVYDHFESEDRCSSDYCLRRLQEDYDRKLKQLGIKPVPSRYWLIVREASPRSFGSILFYEGIVSAARRIFSDDNDGPKKEYRYTNSVNHYRTRLLELYQPDFPREAQGYPYGIENLAQFRVHPLTSQQAREKIIKSGVALPAGWTIADRPTFNGETRTAVRVRIDWEWEEGVVKRGLRGLPPNLSWQQFQRASQIQTQIKHAMGEYYVDPVLADWNNEQFHHHVIEPNAKREASRAIAIVDASTMEFADGASYEELGKRALRATIIPPISMGLSLFLALATVLKLPGKIQELRSSRAFYATGVSPAADKATAAASKWRSALRRMSNAPVQVLQLALLAALLIIPLLLSTAYTRDDTAVSALLGKVQENSAVQWSLALRWVLNTQPLIMPIGEAMDKALPVFAGFKVIQGPFDTLDRLGQNLFNRAGRQHHPWAADPSSAAAWGGF